MKSSSGFMKRSRVIGVNIFISLTIMSFAACTLNASQVDTNRPVFTISGKIDGLGGVEMRGLPGNVVTDKYGFYSGSIESGWSGTVRPVKAGYKFEPASISYNNITEGQVQDYKAERIMVTISGSLGLEGVVMNGLPGTPATDSNGIYSIRVPFDWAGNVKPFKAGYEFNPPMRIYSAVSSDQANQDYTATVLSFQISGNTGISRVQMRGLPGNVVSGSDGSYRAVILYGWSGKVIPVKEGFEFSPSSRTYSSVADIQTNQNYIAVNDPGNPLVSQTFINDDLIAVLDSIASETRINIMYPATVMGIVSCNLNKVPLNKALEIILAATPYGAEKKDGYYLITIKKLNISGTILYDTGKPVEGLHITSENGDSIVTDSQGRYSLTVDYNWKGMIMPESQGYTFNPTTRQYSAVTRDQTNQNYTARVKMLTISDTIQLDKNNPIPGVNVLANPGNIKTVTDTRGQFSIQVPYGWSGDIFLSKPGLMIDSPAKSYKNVTTDIINGIPVAPKTTKELPVQQSAPVQSQVTKSEGRKILIVPDEAIEQTEIVQTKEDINIMAEIFDERFREPQLIGGVLRDFGDFFGRDNKQTEAIYIQDYGVIFMMDLDYQFPAKSQSPATSEEQISPDTDQTWERARQRVLSTEASQGTANEYAEQMVNILKTELIRTLKYASNIRNLKSDEWVILSVEGTAGQSRPLVGGGMFGGTGGYGGGGYGGGYGGYGATGSNSATNTGSIRDIRSELARTSGTAVMTMRAKKSDIESFASGELSFEQFREKVQILMN